MTSGRMHVRFRARRRCFWCALVVVCISTQVSLLMKANHHVQSNNRNNKAQFILQRLQQQSHYQQQKRESSHNNIRHSSSFWWNATYKLPPREVFFTSRYNESSPFLPSSVLPPWLTLYIEWHHEQLVQLNKTMDDSRFLVLTCRDPVCGGLSDRLKSVPLLLQLAALYDRIFMIHWERPAPLEYYLLPRLLDWRVPGGFLTTHEPTYRSVNDLLVGLRDSNVSIVQVILQDQHGGSSWYNRIEEYRQQGYARDEIRSLILTSSSHSNLPRHFRQHFRSIWSALFIPSPFLAQAIQERQTVLGLTTPYVAAHVRALYRPITQQSRYEAWVMHAMQCARVLRPHTPMVLLSDSVRVLQAALAYAHSHPDTITRVAPVPQQATIVHLDQAEPRPAQDYMGTFVDLYIMAQAQCIAHGRGGFGRLGVLLSQNASCFFNYYQGGKTISCDG